MGYFMILSNLSNEKNLVVWGMWGIIIQNYMGIIINHYKDPYWVSNDTFRPWKKETTNGRSSGPRVRRSQKWLGSTQLQFHLIGYLGGMPFNPCNSEESSRHFIAVSGT